MKQTNYEFFISYSHRDEKFAEIIQKRLIQFGQRVWIDWERVLVASDWISEVQRGIETADVFIFVVSQYSLRSTHCNMEINYAMAHKKLIFPVFLHKQLEIRLDLPAVTSWSIPGR